ncbi:hypothetical protein OG874_35745 [Nocardia sp. NBC_00565]|uniref:hypothetical protein n=1 Tax=Nocardia sp. NBC_00565 TaxID=2975993 RepID=UPI002E80576B|nr:hypothetical protein [Nocardia sp. NBC_00565]WUC02045.1 hypothetical protein OG874_35745 [Nocardia sp. NBC_00565]
MTTPQASSSDSDAMRFALLQIIETWRESEPSATRLPRSVRKQINHTLRDEVRRQEAEHQQTREAITDWIRQHRNTIQSGRAPKLGETVDQWFGRQQSLAQQANTLEDVIQRAPHLSETERGQAIETLRVAHNTPDAPERSPWQQKTGLDALRARVAAWRSRQQLTGRIGSVASRFTSRLTAATGPAAWTTPQQSAALNEVSKKIMNWEHALRAAIRGDQVPNLADLAHAKEAAMNSARALGISEPDLVAHVQGVESMTRTKFGVIDALQDGEKSAASEQSSARSAESASNASAEQQSTHLIQAANGGGTEAAQAQTTGAPPTSSTSQPNVTVSL